MLTVVIKLLCLYFLDSPETTTRHSPLPGLLARFGESEKEMDGNG